MEERVFLLSPLGWEMGFEPGDANGDTGPDFSGASALSLSILSESLIFSASAISRILWLERSLGYGVFYELL